MSQHATVDAPEDRGRQDPAAPPVPVNQLIGFACMAPSVHNSQPWLWGVDGDRVHLFADYHRRLPHTDPDDRDLVISCGAALHHLRVAAAALGWRTSVTRRPNQVNNAYLATVSFTPEEPEASAVTMLEALRRRRTDRRPTAPTPVRHEDLDPLLGATAHIGVVAFAVVSGLARAALLHLLADADATQRQDPDYVAEIQSWVDRGDSDGVPSANLLRHGAEDVDPTDRFPSGSLPHLVPGAAPAALLAICTASDNVESRLRAGEALSAVLLQGEMAGLSMAPLSQATELMATRKILQQELLRGDAEPQILVKAGWPGEERRPVQPTPRRPLREVVAPLEDIASMLGA